jgi:hypothetical protein
MADRDTLQSLLEMARREMPDVSDEVWSRFAILASLRFACTEFYVPAPNRKRAKLEMLAQLDADLDSATLATKLGVSVRRAQQLRRLR